MFCRAGPKGPPAQGWQLHHGTWSAPAHLESRADPAGQSWATRTPQPLVTLTGTGVRSGPSAVLEKVQSLHPRDEATGAWGVRLTKEKLAKRWDSRRPVLRLGGRGAGTAQRTLNGIHCRRLRGRLSEVLGCRLPGPKSFPFLLMSGLLPSPDLPLGAAGGRCWELALPGAGHSGHGPSWSGTRRQSHRQRLTQAEPHGSPSSFMQSRDCLALA